MTIILSGTTGIQLPLGSAAAPSKTNTTAQATGLFYPSSTSLAMSTSGVERFRIDSSGNVGIGTSSPSFTAGSGIMVLNATQANYRLADGTNIVDLVQNNGAGYLWNRAASFLSFGTSNTEKMRIDSSGNVGIGITSPAKKLDVAGGARFVQDAAATTGAIVLRQNSGDTVGGFIQWVNNGNTAERGWMTVDTSSNMMFATASSEKMRIDGSGNVGIGAAPSYQLDVSGTGVARINPTTGTNQATLFTQNTGGYFYFGKNNSAGTSYGTDAYASVLWSSGAYPMVMATNGTERMRINSSGNVGIGTSSPVNKLSINSTSAPLVSQVQISHPSGDWGLVIKRIAVDNGAANFAFLKSRGEFGVITAGDSIGRIAWQAVTGGAAVSQLAEIGVINANYDGTNADGVLYFSTKLQAGSVNERMRIDSSGNVGIGTSSPGYRLEVKGASGAQGYLSIHDGTGDTTVSGNNAASLLFQTRDTSIRTIAEIDAVNTTTNGTGGAMVFQTRVSDTLAERMRIDSSGNLLVGTTNSAQNAGNGAKILPRGNVSVVNDGSTGGGDGFDFYNSTAAAYRFYVTGAGVINATTTTITAISDQRLKENIKDIDVGLDAVMALKPRKFDWKKGKGKDIKGDRGWIAQEFEQVFPDMISTWKDEPPEGEEPYKAVNADLIPVLVKAIQELTAKVTTLEEKLAQK